MHRLILSGLLVIAGICFVTISIAQTTPVRKPSMADDIKMAREALAPYVRANANGELRQSRLQMLQQQLDEQASSAPKKIILGTLIFSKGVSARELSEIATEHELEVVSLHIKTPYNDRGAIQSIDIGSADLAKYRGDLATRAEKAIGAMRLRFLEWSNEIRGDDARFHEQVAYSPMLIYRCEVYGGAASLQQLSTATGVAAVSVDSSDRSNARVTEHKELMERSRQAWQQHDRDKTSR